MMLESLNPNSVLKETKLLETLKKRDFLDNSETDSLVNLYINIIEQKLKSEFEGKVNGFNVNDISKQVKENLETVLKSDKIPLQVKEGFLHDFILVVNEIQRNSIGDINNLRNERNLLSFGTDGDKSDGELLKLILDSKFISSIQFKVDTIKRLYIDDRLVIDSRSLHKGTYDKFSNGLKGLDDKYGFDILGFFNENLGLILDIDENEFGDDMGRFANTDRGNKYTSMSNKFHDELLRQVRKNGELISKIEYPNTKVGYYKNSAGEFNLQEMYLSYIALIEDYKKGQIDQFETPKKDIDKGGRNIERLKGYVPFLEGERIGIIDDLEDQVERKVQNMGVGDVVIMINQMSAISPYVGNFHGGWQDLYTAMNGMDYDGSKLSNFERGFKGILGTLCMAPGIGYILSLPKIKKFGKMMSILEKLISSLEKRLITGDLLLPPSVIKVLKPFKYDNKLFKRIFDAIESPNYGRKLSGLKIIIKDTMSFDEKLLNISDFLKSKGLEERTILMVDGFIKQNPNRLDDIVFIIAEYSGDKISGLESIIFSVIKFSATHPEMRDIIMNSIKKFGGVSHLDDGIGNIEILSSKYPERYKELVDILAKSDVMRPYSYLRLKVIDDIVSVNPEYWINILETAKKDIENLEMLLSNGYDFLAHYADFDILKLPNIIRIIEKSLDSKVNAFSITFLLRDIMKKYPEKIDIILKFLEKITSSKSDLNIMYKSKLLDFVPGLEDIIIYYLENKQKSLIPMLERLELIYDLGLYKSRNNKGYWQQRSQEEFKKIGRLTDLSWIYNVSTGEAKTKLVSFMINLLEKTGVPDGEKRIKELERYLKGISTFDKNSVNGLKKHFGDLMFNYYNGVIDRAIVLKMKRVFKDIEFDERIIHDEIFIEAFKMYEKASINKEKFKEILMSYLTGRYIDIKSLDANKGWIDRLKGKLNISNWLSRNEKIISIPKDTEKVDVKSSMNHFLTVSNNILKKLGIEQKNEAGALIHSYDTIFKKDKSEIISSSGLPKDEAELLFSDLKLQIDSIKAILKGGKAKDITQIKIYKENDPMRVLMMGNWVDGSCLSVNSNVGNFWSTATNALDVNKGVFYIEDQSGNIIGRVLTAIDDNGKLIRFPTYFKGNIAIDIDKYFDNYIKGLSNSVGFGINGNPDKVSLLNGEKWYIDPIKLIEN